MSDDLMIEGGISDSELEMWCWNTPAFATPSAQWKRRWGPAVTTPCAGMGHYDAGD
ncbi:hypothetical protein [Marinobacter sp.]|uniref:hypothetical protein n=1 Tax=Marinobacter sp. TaxID=50741 RepID=UPI0038500BA8